MVLCCCNHVEFIKMVLQSILLLPSVVTMIVGTLSMFLREAHEERSRPKKTGNIIVTFGWLSWSF